MLLELREESVVASLPQNLDGILSNSKLTPEHIGRTFIIVPNCDYEYLQVDRKFMR